MSHAHVAWPDAGIAPVPHDAHAAPATEYSFPVHWVQIDPIYVYPSLHIHGEPDAECELLDHELHATQLPPDVD